MNPHEVKTVKCAGCGTIRQEANHWLTVDVDATGRFIALPFVPGGLKDSERPVCGQACAQQEFGKWMTRIRNGK